MRLLCYDPMLTRSTLKTLIFFDLPAYYAG